MDDTKLIYRAAVRRLYEKKGNQKTAKQMNLTIYSDDNF